MSTLRLVPVSGPPVEVEKEQSVVGRDPGCDIVVTDGSVSRRHARLELRGSEWWVIDQGSANGTYINSVRVAEQELKNGQELRFGALSYQIDLVEDPEATVATPVFDEHAEATVISAEAPPQVAAPPAPIPPPATAAPSLPPPMPVSPAPPRAAAPPPAPRPPAAPVGPRAASPPVAPRPAPRRPNAPVPQMAGGAAPAKKGRSPIVWVGVGCCGCLLLIAALMAVIGGGVNVSTKGAADAAHAWIAAVRQGGAAAGAPYLSAGYQTQVSDETNAAVTAAIQQSTDATFYQRSIENDRAVMKGVLTGSGSSQPITVHLLKEGGAWKVDAVALATP
jgi:predicted component of type VI protein secretion system